LSITFKLEQNVEKLTTSSSNITLGTASNGEQTASVEPVKANDSFKVVRPTGESHDPQIVVTPLT
jgi:hypothetical protein